MALAVCLLFDSRAERTLRLLWDRLEDLGVPTLRSHTHGRHVPHLSYVVLRSWDHDRVRRALAALPPADPVQVQLDALGVFRRGRAWLVPSVSSELVLRQERVVHAARTTGAELHRHYEPGVWTPHVTLAPRVPLTALPVVAAAVNELLPLPVRLERAALVDSGLGKVQELPRLP